MDIDPVTLRFLIVAVAIVIIFTMLTGRDPTLRTKWFRFSAPQGQQKSGTTRGDAEPADGDGPEDSTDEPAANAKFEPGERGRNSLSTDGTTEQK